MATPSPQHGLTGLGWFLACALCRVIWHHTEVLAGIRTDPLRGNSSTGAEGGPAPPPIAPLSLLDALAGLARLPRLNVLQLVHNKDWMPEGGIPTQWVAPGAFPSLTK